MYGSGPGIGMVLIQVMSPTLSDQNSGSSRVLRGGGWHDDARNVRVANRSDTTPGYRNSSIGFRLARTVNPPPAGFKLIPAGTFTMGPRE